MPSVTIRVDRKKGDKAHSWWSEKQKLDSLALYITTGDMNLVSEKMKIPVRTLWRWKYEPWWKAKIKELEEGNNLILGTKVTNILSKGTDSLLDRLENGNYIYNKESKTLARKPLSAREIVEIVRVGVQANDSVVKAKEAIDSRDLREKTAQATLSKLQEIADKLNHKPQKVVKNVIDVEPIDYAIESGIQEELPTREQVQVNAGSDSQAGVA